MVEQVKTIAHFILVLSEAFCVQLFLVSEAEFSFVCMLCFCVKINVKPGQDYRIFILGFLNHRILVGLKLCRFSGL